MIVTLALICFDGNFVKRPSGPRGTVPPLLCSCLNSAIGLHIHFLCNILPFELVILRFVSDIASCGSLEYALSNFDPWCFFSKEKKIFTISFPLSCWVASQTHRQLHGMIIPTRFRLSLKWTFLLDFPTYQVSTDCLSLC